MKRITSLLLAVCCFALISCGNAKTSQTDLPEVVQKTTGHEQWDTPVDYSKASNWLNIPAITKDVDVVYFYPTCYAPSSPSDLNVSSIDNAVMRKGAANVFAQQATAFQESCNIFAPFYRQLDATFALTLTEEENGALFQYATSKDASGALDYYFENFNQGRPFILAGHSQGAETLLYLLAGYFKDHQEYYSRMIAAYVIGYSVTSDILSKNPHLKFATGATDTGVIVSWNTEGPENSGQHNAVLLPNAISINPLNWKLDATKAEVSENLGSFENGQFVAGFADAQIDPARGSVICTSVDPAKYSIPMPDLFGPQCYHGWDYGFYYSNIGANAKQRIEAFLN